VPFGTLIILRELGSLLAFAHASHLACHDVGSLASFLASFFDDEHIRNLLLVAQLALVHFWHNQLKIARR